MRMVSRNCAVILVLMALSIGPVAIAGPAATFTFTLSGVEGEKVGFRGGDGTNWGEVSYTCANCAFLVSASGVGAGRQASLTSRGLSCGWATAVRPSALRVRRLSVRSKSRRSAINFSARRYAEGKRPPRQAHRRSQSLCRCRHAG